MQDKQNQDNQNKENDNPFNDLEPILKFLLVLLGIAGFVLLVLFASAGLGIYLMYLMLG